MKRSNDLSGLEAKLGHEFRRPRLLQQALTHSSFAREQEMAAGETSGTVPDNEQLEFLGDAVLSLVVSSELYARFPEYREGQLSKMRAHVVSARHLIDPARHLKIGEFLRLGRGEERSGGRSKVTLQVDALEAILAAMYLDCGMRKVRAFILEHILEPELKRLHGKPGHGLPITDYKSALQETAHSTMRLQPSYVLVKEEGPEHRKTFTVEARIHSREHGLEHVGRGQGSTKKMAEQDAARKVIEHLRSEKEDDHKKAAAVRPSAHHE